MCFYNEKTNEESIIGTETSINVQPPPNLSWLTEDKGRVRIQIPHSNDPNVTHIKIYRTSQNGILIQLGNILEIFWNKVISDYDINLIERNNKIKIGSTNRQLDHLFTLKTNPDIIYYLEAKCNLNYWKEPEKKKELEKNQKIKALTN